MLLNVADLNFRPEFVNTVTNNRVPYNAGNVLSSQVNPGFRKVICSVCFIHFAILRISCFIASIVRSQMNDEFCRTFYDAVMA